MRLNLCESVRAGGEKYCALRSLVQGDVVWDSCEALVSYIELA